MTLSTSAAIELFPGESRLHRRLVAIGLVLLLANAALLLTLGHLLPAACVGLGALLLYRRRCLAPWRALGIAVRDGRLGVVQRTDGAFLACIGDPLVTRWLVVVDVPPVGSFSRGRALPLFYDALADARWRALRRSILALATAETMTPAESSAQGFKHRIDRLRRRFRVVKGKV